MFAEVVVGYAAGLWKAIHSLLNFDNYVAVDDVLLDVIFEHDRFRDQFDGDAHVFVLWHWRAQVEIIEIERHELSIGCREDAVE